MSTEYETFRDDYLGIKMQYPSFLVRNEMKTNYQMPEFVSSPDKMDITPFIMRIVVGVKKLKDKGISLQQVWNECISSELIDGAIFYESLDLRISGSKGKLIAYEPRFSEKKPIYIFVEVMTIKNEKTYQLAMEIGPFPDRHLANSYRQEALDIVHKVVNSFVIL